MKRYEKMSKEEIIAAVQHVFGPCDECCVKDCYKYGYHNCLKAILKWLNEEIKIKTRIATIKTVHEFEKAIEEYLASRTNTRFNQISISQNDFISWLKGEIEVEE